MICSICGDPCRGRCGRCQRPLCYQCMPAQPGAQCRPSCTVQSTPPAPKTQAAKPRTKKKKPAGGSAMTPQGTPYYVPSGMPHNPAYQLPPHQPGDLEQMTPDELLAYVVPLRIELIEKQLREKHYLDRRAVRSRQQYGGQKTPTDLAYEKDQILEDKLIELLYYIEKQAHDHI